MAKAGRGSDQFQIRLPEGLRDRIKIYAERHGRSMNAEIVRVLEREFPTQWSVGDRMEHLAGMLSILKAGMPDDKIDGFIKEFEETVEGVASGRVMDVAPEAQKEVARLWQSYRSRAAYYEYVDAEYDLEENQAHDVTGRYEKYATPPKRPDDETPF